MFLDSDSEKILDKYARLIGAMLQTMERCERKHYPKSEGIVVGILVANFGGREICLPLMRKNPYEK